ncbi:MAG: glycosyltransferase family 2 protein [Bdellovibrionales bacterium]
MNTDLVSVVIPCRNEAKAIEQTIRAILDSEHPNIEVLVVDGMSEDGTRSIVGQIEQADPRVRLIDNPKNLTPYAFNLGVKNARGEFIQIVGARNVVQPDYIPILLHTLKTRPDVACVGGDYQHVYDSETGRLISLAMESKFGVGLGNYRTMGQNAYVDTVGVPMYRRSIFEKVGYFDERLTRNQDDDFNFRLRKRGYKILYVHAAKVTYLVRGSYKKAFEQFRQYGYFKVYVNKKHGELTTLRQLAPAAFVALWVVGLPLSLFLMQVRAFLSFVALIYVGLGFTLAGWDLTFIDRFMALGACFILHVGYGIGYWEGIWDFVVHSRSPRTDFQRQTL